MKRLLCICFFLIPLCSFAQTKDNDTGKHIVYVVSNIDTNFKAKRTIPPYASGTSNVFIERPHGGYMAAP